MDRTSGIRRFQWALVAFAAVLLIGTIGFHSLTDEGWISSLYRAVVTTTLTGLDQKPEEEGAQIFTIFVLFSGVAIFLYLAGTIVEAIARGVLTGTWAERKRRRTIDGLRDHFIICGYGRVGQRIAEEFRQAHVRYVILDFTAGSIEHARQQGDLYIEGSGTNDEALEATGLAHALGLVAAGDSDVDNLYITVSARAARPDLLIVARASTEDAGVKLLRAGANRVVQPYSTAGQEMAKLVLRPEVAAFLEIVASHGGPDLRFEEVEVTAACGQDGKSIRELRIRAMTGALVVGLRRPDGGYDVTPDPDTALTAGDVLIAMGTETELRALEEMFAPREAVAG